MSEKKRPLKHVETKKQEVHLTEEEKNLLEKVSKLNETSLTTEEKTVLEIVAKRKTVDMITREYNLALKPLGKEIAPKEKIISVLQGLKEKNLVKSVIGGDKSEYWVDIKFFREKLLGSDRL